MTVLVLPIQNYEAEPWLLKKHYARRNCSISYAFGAYRGGELIGVITYGMPASPNLCIGLCGPEWKDNVIELNRLCCENTRNIASILVGRSLQMLPKPVVVVSFADTGQGHVGYIYQATNFLYTGLTDAGRKTPRADRIKSNGTLETPDILEMTDAGVLDIVIADSIEAKAWALALPNIKVREDLAVTSGTRIGWAIRKQSPQLAAALEDFRNSDGWESGVDGSIAVVEWGAGDSIDTTNIKDAIIGFVFGNKGLMFNLTLEGSKMSKIKR